MLKTITLSEKEIQNGLSLTGKFEDNTPYELSVENDNVTFSIPDTNSVTVPKNEMFGIWTIQTEENTYTLFLQHPNRKLEDAFCHVKNKNTDEDQMFLCNPDKISPDEWQTIAGEFHKLGYDLNNANQARNCFTRLTKAGKQINKIGYCLQPDQQKVINKILGKTENTQTPFFHMTQNRLESRAVRHFGTTFSYKTAGYITPNGYLLLFSHEGYQRDMDHREVATLFENMPKMQDMSPTQLMYVFMGLGNIRLSINSLNMVLPPTEKQREIIKNIAKACKGEIYLDFSTSTGIHAQSAQFKLGTNPGTILHTIDTYFKTGFLPENT